MSVATNGDAAVVGIMNTGAAHVFIHNGNNWPEVAQLTVTDAAQGDIEMLCPVSMSGVRVVFGNYRDDEAGGIDAGSAYVFDLPHDCNANGVGDVCDIADGRSLDADGNGIPDECLPDGVPTLSNWGMLVATPALLSAGTIVLHRRGAKCSTTVPSR